DLFFKPSINLPKFKTFDKLQPLEIFLFFFLSTFPSFASKELFTRLTCAQFHPDGIIFGVATAADDASIKLWDLRKLKNFKTITLEDRYEIRDLVFDQSGMYLGVAGTDVR
ncbi:unnamed protein product, partial [Rotaria socialis]